jgi:3,4-dihydroxy 2-butanone 4-phosphate synthase/GTP cyclohydrolase II
MGNTSDIQLNTIDEAIEAFRKGELVIVIDDEDRENEGDFITSAELITPDKVNFMTKYGRGLICAPLIEERCDELELELMVGKNTSLHATPFTISVDLLGQGCTTGISASDRAKTIKALSDPTTKPEDLGRPGHIFPLKAKERGVLRRAGHTEATVDLARLAGQSPTGVLVEIMNDDGSMARLPQLMEIAKKFDLKIITIKDLIAYRLQKESLIVKGVKVHLPTAHGDFQFIPFKQKSNGLEHMALIKGTWDEDEPILVRVHSSCATGDIFGSLRCECGEQLKKAMETIEKEGKGVIVYMNQEGRGIGLMNKIKAYKLQEEGRDTVDANTDLGFEADERDYGVGAQILRELGVVKMRLMTNNPIKRIGLEGYGLTIVENIPIEVEPNPYNEFYMHTKKERMGHNLKFFKYMNKSTNTKKHTDQR